MPAGAPGAFIAGAIGEFVEAAQTGGLRPRTVQFLKALARNPKPLVAGLESNGSDQFFCGGGSSGKVRAVRRPTEGPERREENRLLSPANIIFGAPLYPILLHDVSTYSHSIINESGNSLEYTAKNISYDAIYRLPGRQKRSLLNSFSFRAGFDQLTFRHLSPDTGHRGRFPAFRYRSWVPLLSLRHDGRAVRNIGTGRRVNIV